MANQQDITTRGHHLKVGPWHDKHKVCTGFEKFSKEKSI